jgi:hypothetical protein
VNNNWPNELLEQTKAAKQPEFHTTLLRLAKDAELPQPLWTYSIEPEERGLEVWVHRLAQSGRRAYTTAAAAAARYVYPISIERGGEMAHEYGFHEDDISMDGEPPGMQVKRVETWLESPTEDNLLAVEISIDPSRQLNVWDDDLYPSDDDMWFWFLEVAHLTALAATAPEEWGDGRVEESYTWPAQVCAARAVVCALKTIRTPDGDIASDTRILASAIADAFHKA